MVTLNTFHEAEAVMAQAFAKAVALAGGSYEIVTSPGLTTKIYDDTVVPMPILIITLPDGQRFCHKLHSFNLLATTGRSVPFKELPQEGIDAVAAWVAR